MTWQTKLNKWCLWATVFVLPWQLRHIVLWANHQGEFFEYASIAIYLSDILIGLTLLTWWFIPRKSKLTIGPREIFWPLTLLLVWLWVSVWYSQFMTGNWLVGANSAAHFTLLYLFYIYLVNAVKDIKHIIVPLAVGSFLQSVIGISQFLVNHSLGLKYLGESVLDPILSGIPVVMINDWRHLRAHGTLPHANILGGYLAAVLAWVLWIYMTVKWPLHKWASWFIVVGILTGLVVSFSRTAWLAAGLILLVWLISRIYHRTRPSWQDGGLILILFGLIINQYPAIASRFDTIHSAIEQESVVSRLDQLNQFKSIINKYPLTGVGIGQYTLYLEKRDVAEVGWHYNSAMSGWQYNLSQPVWAYQPVHNIWLMALAELGWVGGLLFVGVWLGAAWAALKLWWRQKQGLYFTALGALGGVAILGVFDHYLWTLQPGRLILFLIIGMIAVLVQDYNRNQLINDGRINT